MTVSTRNVVNSKSNSRLSRSALRRRLQRTRRKVGKQAQLIAGLRRENQVLATKVRLADEQRRIAQQQLTHQQSLPTITPANALFGDRPLPGHQFGVKLIAASIELAKKIGFRATEYVWSLLFELLGIDLKVPSHDAIEQWTLRFGVAQLQSTFTSEQRVLWMADHSSQIGKERVLLIIGIALEDLPPAGQPLQLTQMKVLAIVPGEQWKKEDVAREYRKLAEQIGPPVYLLCDGAVELREPAEKLIKDGKATVVLGDLKHHAANLLEKEIGRDERFKTFMSEVGLTRNRVQQTELSHFAPPPLRQKSRFMNLGPLLNWASMVMYHLNDPDSAARTGVDDDRIEQKLGWLRDFADELVQWKNCQEVIEQSLSVINFGGLDANSVASLKSAFASLDVDLQTPSSGASRIAAQLVAWVERAAASLHCGDRAGLSTEILESLFGRYKRLERQHSKGGFTRLIGAFPALCSQVDTKSVRESFERLRAKDLNAWLSEKLPKTLSSRRNQAYQEFRQKSRNRLSPTP